MNNAPVIAVIGLGYVGLPLASALSAHYPVTGYDNNPTRIAQLLEGIDITQEVTPLQISAAQHNNQLLFSSDAASIATATIFIVRYQRR